MARTPKYFVNNSVAYITTRIEEGLPMVPLEFMNELIWSCVAMGASLFDVKLCCLVCEANHLHLLLIVSDPEAVSKFMGYVKQEISHRINRLLGRRQKTNWCDGYDSPAVLDFENLLKKLAYIFTNPVDDCLVEKVSDFKGVTTWHLLEDGQVLKTCRYTSRNAIPRIRDPKRPWIENKNLLSKIIEENPKELTLELHPYAWKECFAETRDMTDNEIHELIMSSVKDKEKECQEVNLKNRKTITGFISLCHQSMLKRHQPKKFGKRTICLSDVKELRDRFISEFKALCAQARRVYESWKAGDFSQVYPPGLFAPPHPRRANILPLPNGL